MQASQYRQAFKQGQRLTDPHFVVIASQNGLDIARLGLAISRKVATRAVDRNRLKRLVRESFRRNKSVLAGLDIVVMARPAAKSISNAQALDALDKLWRRAIQPCVPS